MQATKTQRSLESRLDAPALNLTGEIAKLDNHYAKAGGFGDVHKCRYTCADGTKEVAVKVFRFHFSVEEDEQKASKHAKMIHRELGIWRRLSHQSVVQFLGIVNDFERPGTTSLVSEWMPNGALQGFITQYDDRLELAHRLQLLLDIANGLFYLHSIPLVHGDLTCTNVLINHGFKACLTDFGLASMVGDIPDTMRYLQMTTVRPGALRYAAPEHFSDTNLTAQRTTKSDIYSFGNLALLTLSGKHPWSEIQQDMAVVIRLHQGAKPGRPVSRPIEDRHWEFIERCWFPVDERPQAGDVLSFVNDFLNSYSPTQSLQSLLRTKSDSTIVESPDPSSFTHSEPNVHQHTDFDETQNLHPNSTSRATFDPSPRVPKPPASDHDQRFSEVQPYNVILVGDTGVGKSSVVNLIVGKPVAITSSGSKVCTLISTSYDVVLENGNRYCIWDTMGINSSASENKHHLAITQTCTLINDLERTGGIHLVLFCMKGGRISMLTSQCYNLFINVLCERKVPLGIIATHLEMFDNMEDWWIDNKGAFKEYGISADGHACITATSGYRNILMDKKEQSREKVHRLLLELTEPTYQGSKKDWNARTWLTNLAGKIRPGYPRPSAKEELVGKLVRLCGFSKEDANIVADSILEARAQSAKGSGSNSQPEAA